MSKKYNIFFIKDNQNIFNFLIKSNILQVKRILKKDESSKVLWVINKADINILISKNILSNISSNCQINNIELKDIYNKYCKCKDYIKPFSSTTIIPFSIENITKLIGYSNNIITNYYEKCNSLESHTQDHILGIIKNIKTKFNSNNSINYLLGDSSLDNCHWFYTNKNEINSNENTKISNMLNISNISTISYLEDIEYWLNYFHNLEQDNMYTVNTAHEATTLYERYINKVTNLKENNLEENNFLHKTHYNNQIKDESNYDINEIYKTDRFTTDYIVQTLMTNNDNIIISIGNNDIAMSKNHILKNSLTTIIQKWNSENSIEDIKDLKDIKDIESDLQNFIIHYKDNIKKYIKSITRFNKPKKILICTIYYFNAGESVDSFWGDKIIEQNFLCKPDLHKSFINYIHENATEKLANELNLEFKKTTKVSAIKLSDVLDGTDPNDYKFRVEPSEKGGRKIANLIINKLKQMDNDTVLVL
jgi:hypothetical protein